MMAKATEEAILGIVPPIRFGDGKERRATARHRYSIRPPGLVLAQEADMCEQLTEPHIVGQSAQLRQYSQCFALSR